MVATGPAPGGPGIPDTAADAAAPDVGGAGEPAASAEPPILLAIRHEGEAQAAATIAEARQRGDDLVTLADAAADERVRRALLDAGPAIDREASRIVNEARVRAIHRRARLDADRVEAVFAAAARRLSELASSAGDPRWREAVARLSDEARAFTGEGSSLTIGDAARSAGAGGGVCAESGTVPAAPASDPPAGGDHGAADCESGRSDGPGPSGGSDPAGPEPAGRDCGEKARAGVVSRSIDGRLEADATIETRLAQARLRMADEVARILLAQEGP